MKIIILDDWEDAIKKFNIPLNELRELGDVIIYHDHPTTDELKERLRDADIVIPLRERTKFTEDIIESMKNIKLLAQTGTGLAHLDMNVINKRKIPVSTTPGGATAAVVELNVAFMLALSRNLFNLNNQMKNGEWPQVFGHNLANKTLGLIGLGKIGIALGNVAKAFGMDVIAWAPRLNEERAAEQGFQYVDLKTLLKNSQFVTVQLRLVPETEKLITKEHFMMMRNDAYFINTSRGKIIDEDALIWALENKEIKGAGLDVFYKEPLEPNHPFLRLENVLLAPHIGWKTDNALEFFMSKTIENIKSFVRQNE